jgi:predicted TIM-barrel fold metal-dependent hydrolase
MWGSNFPVEKLWTDYTTLLATYLDVMAGYDDITRDAIFATTARRVYHLA